VCAQAQRAQLGAVATVSSFGVFSGSGIWRIVVSLFVSDFDAREIVESPMSRPTSVAASPTKTQKSLKDNYIVNYSDDTYLITDLHPSAGPTS
jgi:hypothetical protein